MEARIPGLPWMPKPVAIRQCVFASARLIPLIDFF
jgi:hypothetical protein